MGSITQTAVMARREKNTLSWVTLLNIGQYIIVMTMELSLSTSVTASSIVGNLFKNITRDLMKNTNTKKIKFFISLCSWLLFGGIPYHHTIINENPVTRVTVIIAFIKGFLFKFLYQDTITSLWRIRSRLTFVVYFIFYHSTVALLTVLAIYFNVDEWDTSDLLSAYVYTILELCMPTGRLE